DLFLYDYPTDKVRRITKTGDIDFGPRFLADGKRITFARANNLYVMSLEDGSVERLTDIRAAGGGAGASGGGRSAGAAEEKGTDSQENLKKNEKELLDIIKQRTDRTKEQEDKRK